jgi:hypothetical protein
MGKLITQSAPEPVYAHTTRSDRDLRLSGYEVYRFSSHELTPDHAHTTITEFFQRLLNRQTQTHSNNGNE